MTENILTDTLLSESAMTGTLDNSNGMTGTLSSDSSMTGLMSLNSTMTGTLTESTDMTARLSSTINISYSADDYAGDYDVTPTVEGCTLETAGLRMAKDVTVEPIPTYAVSNNTGTTFIIAGE